MNRIGLEDRWAFRLADREGACWGVSETELAELYRTCDGLLNIVGATDLREQQLAAPFRVYVETDPVVAELRLANGDEHTREAFGNHHVIATYGENYGAADCGVPLNGMSYVQDAPADRRRSLARRDRPGGARLHDDRQLPARRRGRGVGGGGVQVEQAPRVGEVSRSAVADGSEIRAGDDAGRSGGSRATRGSRLAARLPVRDVTRRLRRVSRLLPPLTSGVHGREGPERPPAQRLVQRAGRLLSGDRQARRRPGHGLRSRHPDR